MGEGHLGQEDAFAAAAQQVGGEAIGAADQKDQVALGLAPPVLELGADRALAFGLDSLASEVERDDEIARP